MLTKSISSFIEKKSIFSDKNLSEYLNELLSLKKIKKSDIVKKSKLNQTFAYQIFSGERKATRDKILQLSFAMKLDLQETQRLINLSGCNELYCRNRRDAIIIYCINQKMSLSESDDILYQYKEKTICEE